MSDAELQAEQLVVLPQRLETMHWGGWGGGWGGGPVSQRSFIDQSNFNNQIGGDCFRAGCNQFNSQSNWANVDQNVFRRGWGGWGW